MKIGSLLLLLLLFSAPLRAQNSISDSLGTRQFAPRIFMDCTFCDMDYVRTEIPFVNYVRDRKEAQVHVLVTRRRTGSGGGNRIFISY